MSSVSSPRILRWNSHLLSAVLSVVVLSAVSGFLSFFFSELFGEQARADGRQMHIVLSLALIVPLVPYLAAHIRRVEKYRETLHFALGRASLWAMLILAITGYFLLADTVSRMSITFLLHVMTGFAFLIILSGHLALVAGKVWGGSSSSEAPLVRSVVRRQLLYVPVLMSILYAGILLIIELSV